jgi:F-type H+-transporting ATPase subunit gamma
MPNLRDIQKRITSVQSTRQITRTMEMVATAKIRKAADRIESARPYALAMMEVLGNVARFVQGATHPLLEEHAKRERVIVIAIVSDRGLCGAFNSNILRMSEQLMRSEREAGAETDVIAVGKKAIGYFRYRGIEPIASYKDLTDKPTIADARSIAEHVIAAYTSGDADAVKIVFNRFKNVADHVSEIHDLLPIEQTIVDGSADEIGHLNPEYIFEPSADEVLVRLLPTYVETLVYRALLESAASEQGARRTAMKSATDNASEIITTLTRSYNRVRQGAITNEIAEIVGGAAALEDK